MFVSFEKLSFCNILSFGASTVKIYFQKGLNLITGTNGSGKSAILDALSFCLFGKPYRNVTIEKLINRRNKKKLETECTFSVNDKTQIRICRGLKPNYFHIYKNGKKIDLLSSKKLNQDEVDKIIGVNYKMFKQIISLAVNYNKPFLSTTAAEKREVVEQIFNIKIFGQMLKAHKLKNSDVKSKKEINTKTLDILRETIKSIRKQGREIENAVKNFEKDKERDLQDMITIYGQKEKEIEGIEKEIKILEKKYKKIEIPDKEKLQMERDDILKEINEGEYSVSDAEKKIKLLNQNEICPTCNSEITEEHKEKELKILNETIESVKNKRIELKNKIENIKNKINEAREIELEKINISNQLASLKQQKPMLADMLIDIKSKIEEIKNRKLDLNVDTIKKEHDKKLADYKKLAADNKQYENQIHNNDKISEILSDKGIKTFVFKKLTPVLNDKINKYLQTFDIPVRLEFDDYMNENISNTNSLDTDISYNSYSEGEKKRIDISILLSFMDITKIICNWSCNLIIFDELFDGAVDVDGLEKMIVCLKQIIRSNRMCAYVISHRLHEVAGFAGKFKIAKNHMGFSYTEKIEEGRPITD